MPVQLKRVHIQGDRPGPHLVITGGVHGDEFEPIAAIRQLIEVLQKPEGLLRGSVTLVPCVNEEAFLLGNRCASDGKDLARTCPGDPEGTVTEQTAWALSELIRSADYYIDLHTGGTELSIYPLAGYVLHPDQQVLNTQRKMAQAFNLNVVWGTSPLLEGRSLSVARDAHVPAIYCEYLGAASCSAIGVQAYLDGCLNVLADLKMIESRQFENRVEHLVEDSRPASGHLQVCNPSPVDGYFEAAVQLGQNVDVGELLGVVYALQDDRRYPIHAETKGIVIVLRTFPRVRAGESVGVILEL